MAKIGSARDCGGKKALLVSILLTPLGGLLYVIQSPGKNILKITHYRCHRCHLEYTTNHKYCPSCMKEGKLVRIEKVKMHTY
ncbi:MAG: hypothetical protein JW731_00560 [Bacteroidales bacterium]|nr:hypothetical protein [Bacteroidales bacterium]